MVDNEKGETICAVVVTYNRKQLLGQCLDALLKQTHLIEAIYIIDNSSTDGTAEYLIKKGFINQLPPGNLKGPWQSTSTIIRDESKIPVTIHYVRMNENTGGAGGFHEGVKRGYEAGYDWLWLMDDDVEPYENALEKLISYKSISLCIHPRKKDVDGGWFCWERYIDVSTGTEIALNDIGFENGKKWTTVNVGCFEGMLIHRIIVGTIGYPDSRFFIMGDDTIYGLAASMHTNVIYVSDAILQKKILKMDTKHLLGRESGRSSPMAQYFSLRNYMLRAQYLKQFFPLNYNHRKVMFNFVGTYLRRMLGAILYDKSLKQVKYVTMGFVHGLALKSGKSIKIIRIKQS